MPAINSFLVILIFLYLIITNNKVQKEAIKNLIVENKNGGIDFSDSSTSSNVTPQINVVTTKPKTAKK